MSETPFTDSTPHNVADLGMLCRKLKLELNAANVEIEEKRKDVVWLATEKAKLENRIDRLEEAGDKLHWAWMNPFDPLGETIVANWTQAKEDKL